jgi:hypothetical protein
MHPTDHRLEESPDNSESDSDFEFEPNSEQYLTDAGNESEALLRRWCAGQPARKSYLSADGSSSPRFPLTRRSTLADKPELDVLLAATKVRHRGHWYLPLTTRTIHRLSKFVNGSKPIANMTLFECILIDQEVNGVHADHVVSVLERIGEHCNHLLVKSPIQTSELGNVFNREADNVSPGNDWDCILKCFPNLKHLAFIHPIEQPVDLTRGTFFALQMAVANRQTAQQVKRFSVSCPPALLTYFYYDFATAQAAAALDNNNNNNNTT